MKIKCMFLLCVFAVSLSAQGGFVHLEKGKLAAGNGTPLKLDGVNLGGWLLWEGWIWGGGFNRQSKIYSRIAEAAGEEQAQKFREAVYRKFITEKDIRRIAQLCFNVVRVPFNHRLLEDDSLPYQYKNEGWGILDSLIAWCEKYKVYVVLDLHGAPGGQNNLFISDHDKINLWESEANRKRTVALWKAIAQRYANRSIIAGYDLLNEPSLNAPADLVSLYSQITAAIRTVDKHHLLMLEGNRLASDFSAFTQLTDSNTIFSFHFYTFLAKHHEKRLGAFQQVAAKFGVPLWCGEWGENKPENLKVDKSFLENSMYDFCGQCIWTWKRAEKDAKRPAINKIPLSGDWQKLMKYTQGAGGKPARGSAEKALQDFLAAIAYDPQNESPEMISLLRRCAEM